MICGYLDNSGFPNIWTDSNYPIFPTCTAPSDNYIFLRRDGQGNLLDDVEMYPSRCALSASEMGVFGLTYKGHVDDYWQYAPFTNLAQAYAAAQLTGGYDGYCKDNTGNLQWTSHENIAGRGPNCLADYMGSSARYYRGQTDGNSQYVVAVTGPRRSRLAPPSRGSPMRGRLRTLKARPIWMPIMA